MAGRDPMPGMVLAAAGDALTLMGAGEPMEAAIDEHIAVWAVTPGAAQVPRDRVEARVRSQLGEALSRSGRRASNRPERDLAKLPASARGRIIDDAIEDISGPDPAIG